LTHAFTEGITKLYEKIEVWSELIIKMLPNIILAILIILLFRFLSKRVYKVAMKAFERTHFNENLEELLASISQITVICLGIIFALDVLDLHKTVLSLLAGVGVIGLALGFAFQDLASNFIAGVMLAVRAPIRKGDVIEINGTMGSVVDLRLRDTHMRNFDGQDIFIPNKDFTTSKLTNFSSYGMRKLTINVGIGYENDAEQALAIFEQTVSSLSSTSDFLSDPAPSVHVDGLGASSVNLTGFIWYRYPGGDFFQLRSKVYVEVKKDLVAAGFNIPFPIRTLDVPDSVIESIGKQFR
jgi:small conductance mechanosensitive channel